MSIIERIEAHLSIQPRITNMGYALIGYALLHESLDELKKRQWIPVTERLPEKDGEYLAVVEDGELRDKFVVFYDEQYWAILMHQKVTHWMPLPELPHD